MEVATKDITATISVQSPADFDEQLGAEITLLAGQINAANYHLLKLIAAFDERKGWSGGGTVKSCAHWLNWKCGIAMGAAREKVRVAHSLQDLPLIDASFAAGEISYSKVRAMTRVATPETEEGRKLVYYQDDDGMWVINARLTPEAGSLLVKAIEAMVEPVQAKKREQLLEQRQRQERENVSAGTFSETVKQEDPDHFQELVHHSRADALVTLAEQFLATSGDKAEFRGLKGSERCQVMLHVDINTLRRRSKGDCKSEAHCQLDNKAWVSAETARRLSCDASLVTVLEDKNGDVLNIGRRARTVPASIKRALDVRDKTCRFPGCCEARYVDAHHIEHWADGGETSLDNLVTLCRFHHRQLHRGCFDVRVETSDDHDGSQLVFATPAGRRIETDFCPQFSPEAIQMAGECMRRGTPGIEASTCVPAWQGERCDYGMVIDAMLKKETATSPRSSSF